MRPEYTPLGAGCFIACPYWQAMKQLLGGRYGRG